MDTVYPEIKVSRQISLQAENNVSTECECCNTLVLTVFEILVLAFHKENARHSFALLDALHRFFFFTGFSGNSKSITFVHFDLT